MCRDDWQQIQDLLTLYTTYLHVLQYCVMMIIIRMTPLSCSSVEWHQTVLMREAAFLGLREITLTCHGNLKQQIHSPVETVRLKVYIDCSKPTAS